MAEKPQHDQRGVGLTWSVNAEMKNSKDPKTKLDFNAPLLSTRPRPVRRSASSRTSRSFSATERVPFCWEQVPGKPKDMQQLTTTTQDHHWVMRPKLPPCRWHPSSSSFDHLTHSTNGTDTCEVQLSDGFDADVNDDDENGMFSDAMDDMFSLSEAIDFVEKEAEKTESHRGHGLDGFEAVTSDNHCEDYPDFIIQRFLPAATALAAASSAANDKKQMHINDEDDQKMRAYTGNGCGLEKLFTWRMKHKPCGIRSPVCQSHNSSSVNLKCHQLKTRRSD